MDYYVVVQKPPPYQNGHFNWHNGIAKTRQTEKWTGKGEAYIVSRNYQDRSITWIVHLDHSSTYFQLDKRDVQILSHSCSLVNLSCSGESRLVSFSLLGITKLELWFFVVSSSGEGLLMSGDFRCGCLKKKQQDFDEKRSTEIVLCYTFRVLKTDLFSLLHKATNYNSIRWIWANQRAVKDHEKID